MIADLAADWLADMAWGIMTDDNAHCPTLARAYAESTGQAVTGTIFWTPSSSLGAQYAHNGISEEHMSEPPVTNVTLVCRLLLDYKNNTSLDRRTIHTN